MWQALRDFSINVAAGLFGFCFGATWQWARATFRLRKAREFWRPFIRGGCTVVLGSFHEFAKFEPSGFLGVGDAMALTELQAVLKPLGCEPQITYADRIDGDARKQNLIILGGPDANFLAKEIAPRVLQRLAFGDTALHEVSLYDNETGQAYEPKLDAEGGVQQDFALIVAAQNPFDPDRRILLIAGAFGFGTWGGVRYLQRAVTAGIDGLDTSGTFERLVSVEVSKATPQLIERVVPPPLSAGKAHEQKGANS